MEKTIRGEFVRWDAGAILGPEIVIAEIENSTRGRVEMDEETQRRLDAYENASYRALESAGHVFCDPGDKELQPQREKSSETPSPWVIPVPYLDITHHQVCAVRYISADEATRTGYGCTCPQHMGVDCAVAALRASHAELLGIAKDAQEFANDRFPDSIQRATIVAELAKVIARAEALTKPSS